ncbi:MAG: alpha-glucosidase [Epulopiscium sp. Nele67-Bin001]|nr:MAG: alpha-glucosidase [Epulopiscium sp. Nele67-Bin001]
MEICSTVKNIEIKDTEILVTTNCNKIKIVFVTQDIVRIRASFNSEFAEESYVLTTTAWEDRLDHLFEGERTRIEPVKPEVIQDGNKIIFSTCKLKLALHKEEIYFELYNSNNELLYSDVPGNPYILDSNHRINHYSKIDYKDCFYGFGEKPGELNKAQHYMKLSAKDAMGFDAVDTDSLYKHIPFYIKLNYSNNRAVGIFYHNFYESSFNMGREKSNYWPYYSVWQADGGDIDMFLIGGDTIKNVVNNYTILTGRPFLMPKRALGYQGSSMYYPELEHDCDDAVLGFVDTVKEEGFPIDGFHLSSGFTAYEGKRCVFTWNTTRFKDPIQFFNQMNEKGAQCVPNVKPGILLCHPWFDKFVSQNVFIKDSKNENTYSVGKWWGGNGAFWDYTNENARRLWKDYLIDSIIKTGTESVWNDNCEYDSLLDKDAICDFDGKTGTIGQLKPIMSTMMCKISHEAIREHKPNARPYVVCRSGSAGIQRYAQTWCGDNSTSWKSLKYNIATILGMGLSGCPNEGSDIGGFYGTAPDEELFVRWVQQGIFQPRFSIHSTNTDNTVTEPWMYHHVTKYIRDALLLRYKMLPYLYSALYEASQTGAPIMRALIFEFQNDMRCLEEGVEYMYGKDILVSNVVEPNVSSHKVYLPIGCKWYDFHTFKCYEGGQDIEVSVTIDTIPMFIREGAIIPMAQNQIMNMENDEVTALKLIISPQDGQSYTLYNDDGVTNDFEKGIYRKTQISVSGKEQVVVNVSSIGSYKDSIKTIVVEMIAKEKSPFWIKLDDNMLEHFLNRKKFEQSTQGWYYSQTKKAAIIKYNNIPDGYKLTVSFETFDMIGM